MPGAFRINPDEPGRVHIETPETGKAPLAAFVGDVTAETADQLPEFVDGYEGSEDANRVSAEPLADASEIEVAGGPEGVERALRAVADSAVQAAERARQRDAPGTDRALEAIQDRLERVLEALEENNLNDRVDWTVRRRVDRAQQCAD